MNSLIEIENTKVYVGTYKKYNESSLLEKWLLLNDYVSKREIVNNNTFTN